MRKELLADCLILLFAFAFAPTPALAQGNLVMFQVGGTWTKVQVLNTTDAVVFPSIGDNHGRPLRRGEKYWVKYGYGWTGNVAVTASICSPESVRTALITLPTWATDPAVVGKAALPPNYSDPSVEHLKVRVSAIKTALNDRLGGKDLKREIGAWFKEVKKGGLGATYQTCSNPTPLVYTPDVSQWGYARTITVIVASRPDGQYYLQPSY